MIEKVRQSWFAFFFDFILDKWIRNEEYPKINSGITVFPLHLKFFRYNKT